MSRINIDSLLKEMILQFDIVTVYLFIIEINDFNFFYVCKIRRNIGIRILFNIRKFDVLIIPN